MNKIDFSLEIIKKHEKTKEDYFDILLDIVNKEGTDISYDNINKYLTEDLVERLMEECKQKRTIKRKYYKEGLFRMTELM